MAIQDVGKNNQQTRDEIGSEPDIQPIYKVKGENLLIEEVSTVVNQNSVGHSFILGHSENGVLGSPALGDDGGQVVLGDAGRVLTLQGVSNPNNKYIERFNYTLFNDSGVSTADWTGNGSLSFTTGEVAQSEVVAKDGNTWTRATIIVGLSSGVIGDLALQLSADGGSNFENVSDTVEHSFTNTGTDFKFKITASGTVVVNSVQILYG